MLWANNERFGTAYSGLDRTLVHFKIPAAVACSSNSFLVHAFSYGTCLTLLHKNRSCIYSTWRGRKPNQVMKTDFLLYQHLYGVMQNIPNCIEKNRVTNSRPVGKQLQTLSNWYDECFFILSWTLLYTYVLNIINKMICNFRFFLFFQTTSKAPN
jgi:hypothetical protein